MYYDIHTHQRKADFGRVEIENIFENFHKNGSGKVSMGLHPWHLDMLTWQSAFEELEQCAENDHVVAIGECGLDRLCNVDFHLQKAAFEKHIQLAEKLQKPLIIHCVKSHSEVLAMLKGVSVPVVFHGINNKLATVAPLIVKGYYLSFGKSLLSSNEHIKNTFVETPMNQMFLETDDLDMDITEIYKLAAEVKNIDEKEIALQLERNFLTVFGN